MDRTSHLNRVIPRHRHAPNSRTSMGHDAGEMVEETLTFQRETQAFRQETQGTLQAILRRLPGD